MEEKEISENPKESKEEEKNPHQNPEQELQTKEDSNVAQKAPNAPFSLFEVQAFMIFCSTFVKICFAVKSSQC